MSTIVEQSVMVMDVGRAMCAQVPGKPSPLQLSSAAVTLMTRNKLLHNPKDMVGLVLFGTTDTSNGMYDSDDDQYKHITTVREVIPTDIDLLKYIQDSIIPGSGRSDFLEALLVAMEILNKAPDVKRAKITRRIVLFTNAADEGNINSADMETIAAGLKHMECELIVVGIGDAPDDDDDDDEEEEGDAELGDGTAAAAAAAETKKSAGMAVDRPEEPKGVQALATIVTEAEGMRMSFAGALELSSRFRKPKKLQRSLVRVNLTIADLEIPVWGYIRLTAATKPKFTKIKSTSAANPGEAAAEVKSHRTLMSTVDEKEVSEDRTVKAYKYGKTFVPWPEDEKSMKMQTTKELSVLGFTSKENTPLNLCMGTSVVSFVPKENDAVAAVALSALVKALHEEESVAIVRYVGRANSTPHIGFLMPHIRPRYECLNFVRLPFREDVRPYVLPSLATSKHKPSPEQNRAMASFINKMDLSSAYIDEDGDASEALQPKYTFNPVLQYMYQCIHFRAVNPSEPLPPLDPAIKAYLTPHQGMLVNAKAEVEDIKTAFSVADSASYKKEKDKVEEKEAAWKDIKAEQEQDSSDSKRSRLDGDLSMASLLKKEVTSVGSTTPVEDFQNMIARKGEDLLTTACKQLASRIDDFVELFVGGSCERFTSMVKALRVACIQDEHQFFNTYLQTLRDRIVERGTQCKDLIAALIVGNYTLISSTECIESTVSAAEAETFYAQDKLVKEEPTAPSAPTDDVDDLLDEL